MCAAALVLATAGPALAQDPPEVTPAEGANCVISALNRNAPVAADFSYTL